MTKTKSILAYIIEKTNKERKSHHTLLYGGRDKNERRGKPRRLLSDSIRPNGKNTNRKSYIHFLQISGSDIALASDFTPKLPLLASDKCIISG